MVVSEGRVGLILQVLRVLLVEGGLGRLGGLLGMRGPHFRQPAVPTLSLTDSM